MDFTAMAATQHNNQEMAVYRTAISWLVLQDIQFGPTDATLLWDISTGQPRPIVSACFRRTLFDSIHSLSHPSIRTIQKFLNDRYVWHGIRKQAGYWLKTCKRLGPTIDHINIDIVVMTHLLTMIDRFSRWPETIPLTQRHVQGH